MKKCMTGFLLISILLAGCSNTDKNVESTINTETNHTSYLDYPEKYEKEEGNVQFNCDVVIENRLKTQKIYTATASLCKINVDKAFEELYSHIVDYDTYEYDEKNEYGEIVKTATYVDKSETTFSYGPFSSKLSYMERSKMPYILSAFRLDDTTEDYNANMYSIEKQLDFSKREDVYTNLIQLLDTINAGDEYKYKAYALDYSTLKLEESHVDMEGNDDKLSYKDEWNKTDDCYYFILRQCFENLPVYHVYAEIFSKEADMNTPVQVVISEDGIESLDIEKIFSFREKKEIKNLVSFDNIAKTIIDKYNQILGAGTYEIKTAELYYYVDLSSGNGIYSVYPCWILNGIERTKDTTSNVQIIVDAQTGEEIIP